MTFHQRRGVAHDQEHHDLRERVLQSLPKLHESVSDLTGRYWIAMPPEYVRKHSSFRGSVTLELRCWDQFHHLLHSTLISHIKPDIRVRACVPGFRGTNRAWFPHPEYPLAAPLPFTAVDGRFSVDLGSDRISSEFIDRLQMPHLSPDIASEFHRLGLDDFRLASGVNQERTNTGTVAQRSPYVPYAMFRDEEQWMTARMRFSR